VLAFSLTLSRAVRVRAPLAPALTREVVQVPRSAVKKISSPYQQPQPIHDRDEDGERRREDHDEEHQAEAGLVIH
jgi:hypothetical protein